MSAGDGGEPSESLADGRAPRLKWRTRSLLLRRIACGFVVGSIVGAGLALVVCRVFLPPEPWPSHRDAIARGVMECLTVLGGVSSIAALLINECHLWWDFSPT